MTAGRLALRLAVQLALVAGVASALTGGLARYLVQRAFDARLDVELDARAAEARAVWDEQLATLDDALASVEQYVRSVEAELLAAWLRGELTRAGEAIRPMRAESLDLLEVLDEDGRVLASGTWPERAGFVAAEWADLAEGAAVPRRLEQPASRGAALVARRDVQVGGRRLRLVGGRRIDSRLADRMAGAGAVALVAADGTPLVASSRGEVLARSVGGAAADDGIVPAEDGARWVTATVPLAGGARARVGIDRSAVDAAIRSVGRSVLLLAAAVVLAAGLAGAWIARAAARPVAELVGAVDAIAAGRADYTFTRQTEDAFEQLVTAFSRLHRSLDLQRERAAAAERVAAWREVARRVAHEVKNPLAPIRLTVENLLRARERAPERFDELFDEGAATILEEVERLRRLVQEFSEYARLPQPERRPCDLHALLDESLALWGGDGELEIARHPAAPASGRPPLELSLDRDQIARALQNVIGNAVEAMRGQPAPHRLDVRVEDEGAWVRLEFADRGPGFDAEAARRLFEPYYTTKAEGTGLGLAITHRIVVEHGGLIDAENRADGGGRVVIRLPRSESA